MPQNLDALPELLIPDDTNHAAARRVRRLAAAGRLRRLYAGIYTSNLDSPPEAVVLRHWQAIVGHLLPGGVISHRSAFDGRPRQNSLVITRGKTRRDLELPGLTVHVVPGPGPRLDVPANDVPYGALYLSSDPRRHLENLTRGRGWSDRVLPQQAVEESLDRVLMIGGEHRLDQLRDQARGIAETLGYRAQFKRLDGLIGALLGTQEARKLTARQALARAAGRPYDPLRLEIFDALFAALNAGALPDVPDPAPTGTARENFAFFEAYFSNYIEGTTFTVEEAEDIVFHGQIIENRSEDSHDVLGTFNAAVTRPWRDEPPLTAEDFLHWLRNVNALVMQRRPDKRPGEWKDRPNQAGNTFFVMPELVPGTLREGFERIQALAHPLARAVMTMLVVAEVHPFLDGNGRTARLAMNCVLSAEQQSRIIIPTIYREDYLSPLKALSHNRDAEPLVAAMIRIQRWSGAFDYAQQRAGLRESLVRCNAFQEDLRSYQLVFP
ncbi:Fic family protein [Luteimonas sp. BDR2-5]|uniref:Fic family protein n=1 Tax=Proluteimonas luteida TaxID=2878685 RepID=UPI001E49EDB0|nr:Fic family protein [Luteimonas sp. BDR2-5]MCD9026603.1 Fic family protein [Luteimonas sp. BDR2-5]